MSNSLRIHFQSHDSKAFKYFVVSCLKKEFGVDYLSIEENKIFKPNCDYYFAHGFSNFSKGPTMVFIYYAGSINWIIKEFSKISNAFNDYRKCIICPIDDGLLENYSETLDCFFLGKNYINDLFKKHPKEAWCFGASVDSHAMIHVENENKKAILKADVLGFPNFCVEISFDNIKQISDANKKEFLRIVNSKIKKPALIIGNGVSIPFGSDDWSHLCKNLTDYLSPFYVDDINSITNIIGNSTYSSTCMTKITLPQDFYLKSLWNSIYRKYDPNIMHVGNSYIRSISLAKIKHPNMIVMTYNYDCFLESDIKLVDSSFLFDVVKNKDDYKVYKEPSIIHLHGFIPYNIPIIAEDIVLTDDEYFEKYAKKSWVSDIQNKYFLENVCLFIGSSLSDTFQMSLLKQARDKSLKEDIDDSLSMWKAFAILCLKGLSPKDKLVVINYYLNKGIFIIYGDSFEELPKILNEVMSFDD